MAKIYAERSDVIPLLAEVFRTYGFEGASLERITQGTNLGKGSIYHFFPGGKEEMADAVLTEIDTWFRVHIFEPLRDSSDPWRGIEEMFGQVKRYFASGRRICLVGAFALGCERERFRPKVRKYFADWEAALAAALIRAGKDPVSAKELSMDVLAGIQGALVLARGLDQPKLFAGALERLLQRVKT
jgi:AcrR family transcriptional regulator